MIFAFYKPNSDKSIVNGLTAALLSCCLFQTVPVLAKESLHKSANQQISYASDKRALAHAYDNLSDEQMDVFTLGKSFFTVPWVEAPSATTARDGLGPLFNANTCISCHPGNGGGFATKQNGHIHRSLVFRISQKKPLTTKKSLENQQVNVSGFIPDPVYGAQLNINGVHHVPFEGTPKVTYSTHEVLYADGKKITLRTPNFTIENLNYGPLDKSSRLSPRIALALIGLGQIEKIPEQAIFAHEDIDDRDKNGISGKANRVCSLETNDYPVCQTLGRFSWKASVPTVKQQVAAAMHNDMGLTTPLFSNENCTHIQVGCLQAPKGKTLDVPMQRLDAVSFYITHLKTPAQRNPEQHIKGAQIFAQTGCTNCHVASFTTSENTVIYPYSDFLLHDMGKALADHSNEFLAQPNEWRTPPLWGIGLADTLSKNATYLHDGRAQSIEEAILWHGGEAESIIHQYKQLTQSDRQSLIRFLRSL